ncbi:MAG: hypothetical protein COY11_04105, partial [Candidatus Portnoybacteria bacterium CG_4_10_14_0_2_um_filter_44_20]
SAYWQRLSKKAVLSGVEVIRIFQEEVAKAEKDRNLLEAPPPSSLSFLDKGLLTGIYGFMAPAVAPPIFSVYGAYEQVSGWAQNLWSSAVSKIGSLSASMLSLVGGGSDISVAPPALPEGLTINQAAINQLGEIHPNPSRNEFGTGSLPKEGGGEDDAPIVNIIPQNFPQPINIVSKMPLALSSSNEMVLGEASDIGNNDIENQLGLATETSANDLPVALVSNPTVPLGAGAKSPVPVEEIGGQESPPESSTATSTPEETASTTEEDLIPPETYATSTPILVSQTDSTSSPQAIATSTIVFEFSASEGNSTFVCRLDNA